MLLHHSTQSKMHTSHNTVRLDSVSTSMISGSRHHTCRKQLHTPFQHTLINKQRRKLHHLWLACSHDFFATLPASRRRRQSTTFNRQAWSQVSESCIKEEERLDLETQQRSATEGANSPTDPLSAEGQSPGSHRRAGRPRASRYKKTTSTGLHCAGFRI